MQLIKARNPVLLVETHEEERVVDIVLGLAEDPEALKTRRNVVVYSLTKGLHQATATGTAVAPDKALAQAANATEPTLFVFFDLHHSLAGQRGAEPGTVRAIRDLAEQFKNGDVASTLIIVAPTLSLPVDLEKTVSVVNLPLPGAAEIEEVLEEMIHSNRDAITVDLSPDDRHRLVQAALGLTRNEAENAFARAIAIDGRLDAADVELVLDEKRQTIRKSGLLEFIPPSGDLNDVGGLENLKRWLGKRNSSWQAEAEEWALPFPKGILITGVPGCGKSLTAKCTSSLWGMPLLRLDIGRVFAGLVGSSEQNMRGALELAEATSPSILWIDEIEKGFGSAGGGGDSGTSQRVFGTFLTWMQEKQKPVFVIATANAIDRLPPEFLRKGRFDEIFFVDLPTHAERTSIWNLHLRRRLLPGRAVSASLALDAALVDRLGASSEGFSGAEIEQVVVSACFDAFAERRGVTEEDLLRSIRNTVALSVTQAEQIAANRTWASTRAVAATATEDLDQYESTPPTDPTTDVGRWRGGRTIEF
ncbi:AAA family ATPase [Aquihabitans sp. G128]|nr:AAA family ATPase [Aquihabitans sp. G128]QXC59906.1 AAA family ATPase [Aquihabitans sp. G128]